MAKAGSRQVAALPFRRRDGRLEILLITSRETKRWVIPKGWPMDGLKDYNAARLEAFEEAGVKGRMTRKAIGRYGYLKKLANGASQRVVVSVYVCRVTKLLASWPERGERKRTWVSAAEAADMVNETGLQKIIWQLEG